MNRTSNYRKDDPDFERTNHLVTCEVEDGEYRQFYCERAVNCRKPLFGRLLATKILRGGVSIAPSLSNGCGVFV